MSRSKPPVRRTTAAAEPHPTPRTLEVWSRNHATAKVGGVAASTPSPEWRQTQVNKTMWPPANGTIRFAAMHGPELVCVRYRQDACGLHRYTTIELVVETAPVRSSKAKNQQLDVPIAYDETELRNQAKQLGARWNAAKRAWEMSGQAVQQLGLTDRASRSKKENR